ncbi:hypothetical protein RclHR1_17130003 [Rhizophagus clarus]|uniref:Uncharacterized protein n=1 Tax=Rhizophagus clarus TaxID=94130 RepID=A0A2Z6QZX3_9GLOM|nr:hypothetical protein RclHR1_17130003 [Rhizophagus clarus]
MSSHSLLKLCNIYIIASCDYGTKMDMIASHHYFYYQLREKSSPCKNMPSLKILNIMVFHKVKKKARAKSRICQANLVRQHPSITPGKISQGSKLPFSIEFSEDALDKESVEYQTLRNGVKKVLGVVVGLLEDRALIGVTNCNAHVTETFDQTNASEAVSAEVSIPTAHIQLTHVSGDSKGIGLDNSHKANDYDDLYYGGPDNSIPSSMEKGINEVQTDNDSDCSHNNDPEEEMPDDSDDDGYDGYGGYSGYNEYGERLVLPAVIGCSGCNRL